MQISRLKFAKPRRLADKAKPCNSIIRAEWLKRFVPGDRADFAPRLFALIRCVANRPEQAKGEKHSGNSLFVASVTEELIRRLI